MRQQSTRRAIICGLVLVLTGAVVFAQGAAALQKKLDKPISVKLKDKPIAEVFEQIAKTADVKIQVSPDVIEVLPYGAQTNLDVEITKTTLRKALPRLLYPQGLSWEIKDDVVTIVPIAPLYRMARRATFDELELLEKLLTNRIKKADFDQRNPALDRILKMLRKATDDEEVKILFAGLDNRKIDKAFILSETALPNTVAGWLDAFCKTCGQTWHIDGSTIVVLGKDAQVKRQLQRHVSLDLKKAKLMDVLLGLAAAAKVPMKMQPGVMNKIPQDVRNDFTLVIKDATIDQALQVISGMTGLGFEVSGDSLVVDGAAVDSAEAKGPGVGKTRRGKRSRFLIRTSILTSSGRDLELYIFPEDLPEDVRKALETERKKAIEELQKAYDRPEENPE